MEEENKGKNLENEKEKDIVADLHIHSRFSRACSKNITIENLETFI